MISNCYGFDPGTLRYSSKRTSLIVGQKASCPPCCLRQRKKRRTRREDKGHEFDSYANRPLSERCLMGQERIPIARGANEGNLLQIVQGPGYVAVLSPSRITPRASSPPTAARMSHRTSACGKETRWDIGKGRRW